mgnify:CR=1 FL=1
MRKIIKAVKGRNFVRRVFGIVGVTCLSISTYGIWQSNMKTNDVLGQTSNGDNTSDIVFSKDYYPLDVGKYWIYSVGNPIEDGRIEVERRIVRHERRDERDVYFFEDGSLAYRQGGKVYEINPEGQVDVVFAGMSVLGDSYVYKSQGFRIEKRVSAVDTLINAGHRNYNNCLQVITSFRRSSTSKVYAYASYYAPGIGLVGRQQLPNELSDFGTVELLKDFGSRSM